jgi:hypothetical protein
VVKAFLAQQYPDSSFPSSYSMRKDKENTKRNNKSCYYALIIWRLLRSGYHRQMAKEKLAQSKHRRHNDRNGAKPKKADQYRIKKLCFLVQYLFFRLISTSASTFSTA